MIHQTSYQDNCWDLEYSNDSLVSSLITGSGNDKFTFKQQIDRFYVQNQYAYNEKLKMNSKILNTLHNSMFIQI